MHWDIAYLCEQGERSNNEDCVDVIYGEAGICAVLCDGLGGHDSGELASKCVCDSIGANFLQLKKNEDIDAAVPRLLLKAQEELLEQQKKLGKKNGMKTTVCCLILQENSVSAAYVGDSRIYHFRKRAVLNRSLDHSVPQYLVNIGEIKEKEIRGHPDRNKLIRVMGSEWAEPEFQQMKLSAPQPKDAFLLCSDGFWEWIEDKKMISLQRKSTDSVEWLKNMKKCIYDSGSGKSMDNLSAIAIKAVE